MIRKWCAYATRCQALATSRIQCKAYETWYNKPFRISKHFITKLKSNTRRCTISTYTKVTKLVSLNSIGAVARWTYKCVQPPNLESFWTYWFHHITSDGLGNCSIAYIQVHMFKCPFFDVRKHIAKWRFKKRKVNTMRDPSSEKAIYLSVMNNMTNLQASMYPKSDVSQEHRMENNCKQEEYARPYI